MKICHLRLSKSYARRIILLLLFILLLLCFVTLNRVIHCDENAAKKMVQTPNGEYISKYNKMLHVKSFGNLSKICKYNNDKIHCPDVRQHGETMIRQAQLVYVRMLKIFDLICTKHSIDYWLMSGTLLGAFREHGSIAWDNDADVGMLDTDYERLVKVIRNELPDDIFFQDGSDEPSFAEIRTKKQVCKAKLRDKKSCYGHCLRTGCPWHDGLQVDIFVFSKKFNPGKLKMIHGEEGLFKIQRQFIFPTSRIKMEDIELSGPSQPFRVLETLFGTDYMTPVQKKCPENGFIAIPWYSCEYIKSLPSDVIQQVLLDSMIHDSLYFWYFG